jgi:hypothetical protein
VSDHDDQVRYNRLNNEYVPRGYQVIQGLDGLYTVFNVSNTPGLPEGAPEHSTLDQVEEWLADRDR